MGRRKIEIQPITHERNRSVTFLKRKNGLFKKAYELGVLCQVDVAVIIFEERPGHHVKLYQYCSGDASSMVQRHLRFDGERDTKGPHDFSGTKTEEIADEDDEGDEDDSRSKMNGKSMKPKTEVVGGNGLHRPSLRADMDLDYRSSNVRASPTSIGSPSLPISGERLSSNMRNVPISNSKRPRLAPLTGDLSPESHMHAAQSAPASMGGPNSAGGNGGPTYPYRLEVDLNFPPSGHVASLASSGLPPHGATHPSLSSLYSQTNGLVNSQASSQFIPPMSFDFSRPQQSSATLRAVTFPSHSTSQYGGQQQSGGYQSQHQAHRVGGSAQPHVQTSLFADLLDSAASEHQSSHPSAQNQFSSFDWPVHNQQSSPQRDTPAAQQQQSSNDNWLDFLSTQTSTSQSPAISISQNHGPGRPSSNSVSSTRSTGSYAITPASSSMDGMSPSMLGRKRSRDEDGAAMSISDLSVEDGEELRISGGMHGKLDRGSQSSPGSGERG